VDSVGRDLGANRITVSVIPARYSKTELDAKADLVTRDAFVSTAEHVVTVTHRPDSSGTEVGVADGPPPAGRPSGPALRPPDFRMYSRRSARAV
jgi:hypothetical protein